MVLGGENGDTLQASRVSRFVFHFSIAKLLDQADRQLGRSADMKFTSICFLIQRRKPF
jgi:hypothetical protein